MTEKRPSLAKKHTRQTTQNANDALDVGVAFFIDGETYRITMGDMSALDARELRRQVGMTFPQILANVFDDENADLDIVAAVIWLARRVNGGESNLTYNEVAGETGYDVLEQIRDGFAAERKRLADEAKAAKKPAKKIAAVPNDAASA